MTKILPKDITSYDLFKTFAVVLMIVDHLGFYFFPDIDIFRAIARICVPVWFFFIGYSYGRSIPKVMWVGICILITADIITGLYIFPLNVLVTMVLIRLAIDPLMKFMARSKGHLYIMSIALFLLVIPSFAFLEYGVQGLILAMVGYVLRRKEEPQYDKDTIRYYLVFASFAFLSWQQLSFAFDLPLLAVMVLGTVLVMFALFNFERKTYPALTKTLPRPVVASLQFMGRRTLEIYVAHLVLFKFVALALGDERFGLFQWHWFYILSGF